MTDKAGEETKESKTRYLEVTNFDYETFASMAKMSHTERSATIEKHCKSQWTKEEVLKKTKLTWFEEFCSVMLFCFGVPGAALSIPIVLTGIGLATGSLLKSFLVGGLLLAPLSFLPAPCKEETLSSWMALQILKYFSFKVIFEEPVEENKPYILVAPPHGVFPFGNIVTMIAFPSIMGFAFKGLAASAAVRVPIFRQILSTIGAISASKKSALRALKDNRTIGISTGGVAEVFETNSPTGDETIFLKSRKGIVKLAFETGASLVPCYLFGNTKLLSLWTGGPLGHNIFRKLSRSIGFALILFWGRFFLPIPYRVPILGTMAKPIRVPKKENPTQEEIDQVHQELLDAMIKMFDQYKGAYGWENKKLVIC